MNHKNHGNLHAGRPGMTATPVEQIQQMKISYGHDDKGHVFTTDTDLRLDGSPCRWQDVPDGADVEKLDLNRDGKTVEAVWFKSKR